MDPLRVTYSSDIFVQPVGGASRYFVQLVQHLPELGLDPVASAGFHDNEYVRSLPRSSVRGVRLPLKPARLAPVIMSKLNSVTRRIWEPRSGIFHPTYYTAATPKSRLPTVVTIFDMIHERYSEYYSGDDRTSQQKAAWSARADAIVAISHSTKRDAVEILGLDPAKVTVIHPGIERPLEPASGWPDRASDVVLYVGHRGLYKNWSTLARAMNHPQLSAMQLVCFGGGAMRSDEANLLRELGVLERTQFVAGDDAQLARWYRRATVLAYTSLYEGYGYPPLEATANLCPVVCARTSSLVETMDGTAVMVDDPSSSEGFAEGIVKALEVEVGTGIELPTPRDAARSHAELYRSL